MVLSLKRLINHWTRKA